MAFSYLTPETVVEVFKTCKVCGLNQPIANYYGEAENRNGKSGKCINCTKITRNRQHQLRVKAGKFGKCKNCAANFSSGNVRKTGLCGNCHRGVLSSRFKGGHLRPTGYRVVRLGDGKQVPEHRAVIEAYIGRKLHRDETVHHINGVRDDNRIENLELWVRPHGKGIRVKDAVAWANEILGRYT